MSKLRLPPRPVSSRWRINWASAFKRPAAPSPTRLRSRPRLKASFAGGHRPPVAVQKPLSGHPGRGFALEVVKQGWIWYNPLKMMKLRVLRLTLLASTMTLFTSTVRFGTSSLRLFTSTVSLGESLVRFKTSRVRFGWSLSGLGASTVRLGTSRLSLVTSIATNLS
jgi:hypothetical protein